MLLLLLSLISLAGPVEDARAVLAGHARGRSVEPLEQAASAIVDAQAREEVPDDGPTWDLIASLHLAVAQDGPPTGQAAALGAAVDAVEQARTHGGAPELSDTTAGIALMLTPSLRRVRSPEERAVWMPLGVRVDALCVALDPPPPATVCGQLARSLAPLVLVDEPQAAAALAQRAAVLRHPSRSLDVRVAEALVKRAEPEPALAFTRQALTRWPEVWELHDLAGGTSARLKQHETAVTDFGNALEHIHPELTRQRAVLLRKRAAARVEQGDPDAAIADFEAAETLSRADLTQRYLWGRAHVLAAQTLTAQVRAQTGNRAALPRRAQTHCGKAIPHLQAVQSDVRMGGAAKQALALCEKVVAAEPTGE